MGTLLKKQFSRYAAPLSAVVTAALAGVVVMGGQSSSPAAAVPTARLSSAQVAAFRPFADEPEYHAPAMATPTAAPAIYQMSPSMAVAPSSAMAVYGNIVTDRQTVVEQAAPTQAASGVVVGDGGGYRPSVSESGLLTTSTINIPSATINVGTATINVLSSFKLNYGGKTVLSGVQGQVSPTP